MGNAALPVVQRMTGRDVRGNAVLRSGTTEVPTESARFSSPFYVYHESFDDPNSLASTLGPLPVASEFAPRRKSPPRGLPAYLEGLYRVELLSRDQEVHQFRQMNCLKHLAERERREANRAGTSATSKAVAEERAEAFLDRALEIRSRILEANQRLVVSIAKRFVGPNGDLFEMISEANLSLIKAVDRFDFSRGFRFSTYATWAIRNGLVRAVAMERRRRERFVSGSETLMEGVADHREGAGGPRFSLRDHGSTFRTILDRLNARERLVLEGRYGLSGSRQLSLRQVGDQIGVSKERARQIEIAAKEKLRKFAAAFAPETLPA